MVTLGDVASLNPSDVARVVVALAYVGFAVVGSILIVIDLRSHRLPNRIVLPAIASAVALLFIAAVLGGDWAAFGGALLGGLTLGGFYLMLRLIQPGGMGGGDMKLAVLVGVLLGWVGWMPLLVGTCAAFVLGAIAALSLIATKRAKAATHIAFGPWMIAGAWIGLLLG